MRDENKTNPRMPLTTRGIIYLFVLVGIALSISYLVIKLFAITEANLQYDIAISMIVLVIGLFFTKQDIRIGLASRTVWSFLVAGVFFLILRAIDLF